MRMGYEGVSPQGNKGTNGFSVAVARFCSGSYLFVSCNKGVFVLTVVVSLPLCPVSWWKFPAWRSTVQRNQ